MLAQGESSGTVSVPISGARRSGYLRKRPWQYRQVDTGHTAWQQGSHDDIGEEWLIEHSGLAVVTARHMSAKRGSQKMDETIKGDALRPLVST